MSLAICTLPAALPTIERAPTTPPIAQVQAASQLSPRSCEVCGAPLPNAMRSSARSCSARCRSIKSRASRLGELLERLGAAEAGLREAADALAEYRSFLEHHSGKVVP